MNTNKLRVIQDYEKLSDEIKEQIKLVYPRGYRQHLIKFKNKEGEMVSALPFETDEKIYMVRMTVEGAKKIILKDSDYDDNGMLKTAVRKKYEDEYSDLDYLWDDDDDDDTGTDDVIDTGVEEDFSDI